KKQFCQETFFFPPPWGGKVRRGGCQGHNSAAHPLTPACAAGAAGRLSLSHQEREDLCPHREIDMPAPHTLSITAAAEQIRTHQLSPVDLVRSCLQCIDQLEPRLQ